MIAVTLLALAQAQIVTTGPSLPASVPATSWSCTFHSAEGGSFRLSGRIDEIPAGWDPNSSRPTEVEGEGHSKLPGKQGVISQHASEYFREYQLSAFRSGGERYHINLKLRRGGAGVADITRYVENKDRQPYSYLAAGLCTSDFDPGAAPQRKKP